MSHGKQHEGGVASRTRKQTRMRPRDEEGTEDDRAHSSTHVSPAMRIYRHALESILAMLKLCDLAQVLAVSREWSAAVRSMEPIHASMERNDWGTIREKASFRPLPPIERLVASPLLRHLATIHVRQQHAWTRLNNESLALLAQHAPCLTSLGCELTLTPNHPLILPAKLASLQLQLSSTYPASVINGVLTALAALPSLSRLHLDFSFNYVSAVKVSILATAPSLTDLEFEASSTDAAKLADLQIDQIRSSLGHLQRFSIGSRKSADIARLLQPPVTAQWRDIGPVRADERTGELMLRLPTLTKLDLLDLKNTAALEFLPQLPLLTALQLFCCADAACDELLAALQLCSCITELNLRCEFNSAHWSALFAKLPLKRLTICREELDTLRCFAAGPIIQSLEELTLQSLNLPSSEISHLYGLRLLRTLHFDRCFFSRLPDDTLASFSPPSALLPALTELRHTWIRGCPRKTSTSAPTAWIGVARRLSGCSSDARCEASRLARGSLAPVPAARLSVQTAPQPSNGALTSLCPL